MARVVIVCGYDRFHDIDEYAARVAESLAKERFDAIIASGGFTSAASSHSEAWLMARVLTRELAGASIIIEERAMTTLDNLVHSSELAISFGVVEQFVVYCDSAHRTKVAILSRIVLGRGVKVCAVRRDVPWFVHAFEPASIVFESVAAVVPLFRRLMSRSAAWVKGVNGREPRSTRREAA